MVFRPGAPPPRWQSRRDNEPRGLFSGLFGFVFALFFVLFLGVFASSLYLVAQCYTSNDPNSIACFMISQKHEIGIRQR